MSNAQFTFDFNTTPQPEAPTKNKGGRPRLFSEEKTEQLKSEWDNGEGLSIYELANREGVSWKSMNRYLRDGHAETASLEAARRECPKYRAQNRALTSYKHDCKRVREAGGVVVEADRERMLRLYTIVRRANSIFNLKGQDQWSIDHIIPVSEGGPQAFFNLQIMTRRANLEKSNRTDQSQSLL